METTTTSQPFTILLQTRNQGLPWWSALLIFALLWMMLVIIVWTLMRIRRDQFAAFEADGDFEDLIGEGD